MTSTLKVQEIRAYTQNKQEKKPQGIKSNKPSKNKFGAHNYKSMRGHTDKLITEMTDNRTHC